MCDEQETGIAISELRVDGGPTRNDYLMQFQSDILNTSILVPESEELSGIGVAYMAGIAVGVWDEKIFDKLHSKGYTPKMGYENRDTKIKGWENAVKKVLSEEEDKETL